MAVPTNTLVQVQTYQKSSLAYLLNLTCFVATANTKFKDFEKTVANLGSSILFDLPPRFTTSAGLVATFQPAAQRYATLAVDQSANTSFAFTAQERIFNVDKDVENYMKEFGKSAMHELANQIEANIAANAASAVVNPTTGLPNSNSGPFRFYGDGVTAINSYTQLAQMIANFKNFGAVHDNIKVYLSDLMVPSIIGSGLNQFAPERNNEDAQSWEIGSFGSPAVKYYQSNLLPIHVSGTVGNSAQTLTVVSTNDPTGANITQITLSGATNSDPNAILYGDLLQFKDGVSGQPNLRFLTFVGHSPSGQPVQVRATAGVTATSGGQVTINIFPALSAVAGPNQNLNNNIVAGMQMTALPSHRCGLIVGGNALFIAMPRLPDQDPFATAAEYDDDTAVSLRMTYGSTFGQNQTGTIYDCVWGSVLVPEYSMRIAIPL